MLKGNCYVKISKREARTRYNEGKIIRLMACNLNPHGYWGEPLPVNNDQGKSFESICNEFAYYNCTKETGKTISFYITEEENK